MPTQISKSRLLKSIENGARYTILKLNIQAKFWRFVSSQSCQFLKSIVMIYIVSVACYYDNYQLNSRLTDQLLGETGAK